MEKFPSLPSGTPAQASEETSPNDAECNSTRVRGAHARASEQPHPQIEDNSNTASREGGLLSRTDPRIDEAIARANRVYQNAATNAPRRNTQVIAGRNRNRSETIAYSLPQRAHPSVAHTTGSEAASPYTAPAPGRRTAGTIFSGATGNATSRSTLPSTALHRLGGPSGGHVNPNPTPSTSRGLSISGQGDSIPTLSRPSPAAGLTSSRSTALPGSRPVVVGSYGNPIQESEERRRLRDQQAQAFRQAQADRRRLQQQQRELPPLPSSGPSSRPLPHPPRQPARIAPGAQSTATFDSRSAAPTSRELLGPRSLSTPSHLPDASPNSSSSSLRQETSQNKASSTQRENQRPVQSNTSPTSTFSRSPTVRDLAQLELEDDSSTEDHELENAEIRTARVVYLPLNVGPPCRRRRRDLSPVGEEESEDVPETRTSDPSRKH